MLKLCLLLVSAVAALAAHCLTAQELRTTSTAPAATTNVAFTSATTTLSSNSKSDTTPAVPPDTVVLTIDDQSYTAAEFDRVIAAIVPPATPINSSVRRKVAGMFSEARLLSAEAVRRGLDKDPRVQRSVTLARDQALGQAVAYNIVQGILTNEARARYEANKEGYEQLRARHILIRTADSPVPVAPGKSPLTDEQAKTKAEEIRKRLLRGEDFAAIAAAVSDDRNASQGGELPRFRRMQMMPEFENAAFKLRVGETSEPVKTVLGYEIIQVLERGPTPFDEVKAEIAKQLERDIFGKFLEDLKQAHPATLNENYFGPEEQLASSPPSFLIRR